MSKETPPAGRAGNQRNLPAGTPACGGKAGLCFLCGFCALAEIQSQVTEPPMFFYVYFWHLI
ncbi:MAG: hypothetical protein DRI88_10805 [Bacteroidetes bacterium]|nr:MAG: hypothetical protein DRI88_10805 [Bacteroidota bacterium]